ncbi:MAG: hypothetical protein HY259_03535 [Chloroflexi bacterium]|nr:hypothetical protein [Chloroflexota bacterium]
MSGICGIVHFDGAPVEPELLKQMAEAAAYRGPDGIRYWVQGNVGFAHLALNVTPESLRERQPLVDDELILTADARIDNRAELTSTLTAKGFLREKDPTDADLILAAYRCWGEDCAQQLMGDFAFAIWDQHRRSLFAARDRAGCRVFYYRVVKGTFQWATEAAQLLADPAFPAQLNEEMIAHDLACPGFGGQHESYYLGIEKLGPGERLVASARGIQRERYRDFDPGYEIRYASDEEYAEHFKALFQQAVRARLRSVHPVGLFLSGGLDSASIAATAGYELGSSPTGLAPELMAINWTFGRTPKANEWEYSRAVAERWGFGYQEICVDPFWPLYDYPRRAPHRDEPFSSHMASFHIGCIESIPPARRPRVWMSGYPGDLLVGGNNPFYYLNLLRNGRFRLLARELDAHRRLYHISLKQLLDEFWITPLAGRPLREWLSHLIHRGRVTLREWIPHALIERTRLSAWARAQPSVDWVDLSTRRRPWPDRAKDWRHRVMTAPINARMNVWYDRALAQVGAEGWTPWNDVRLAEFILAIPEEQIARGINHKLILRRAMQDWLPAAVRERRGLRTGPGLYIIEGARREARATIDALLTTSKAAALGLLDWPALQQAIASFRGGRRSWGLDLWVALSLEMWLRAYP